MGKSNSKPNSTQKQDQHICVTCALNKVNNCKEPISGDILSYIDESVCTRYPYICKQIVKYLQERGIHLSKNSITIHISQNNQVESTVYQEILEKIKDEKCLAVVIHANFKAYLTRSIAQSIKSNNSLIKINIQFDNNQNNEEYLQIEQFSELINYYEKSSTLMSLYYKLWINLLRIDVEQQFFQIDIFSSLPHDFNLENIKLLPTQQRCKFKAAELQINSNFLKDNVNSLLDFLEMNAQTLKKIKINYQTNNFGEYHNLLDKLTQMNESYHQLNEVRLHFNKEYYEIYPQLDNYFSHNQNLNYFVINNIGIHQQTIQIGVEIKHCKRIEELMINLIQNIPKISHLHIFGDKYQQGKFMENMFYIPDRRIKLTLEMEGIVFEQQYKLLKQLSHNQYFEIELQRQAFVQYIGDIPVFSGTILDQYQNEMKLYMIILIILKSKLQKVLYHRAENSFIDLYIGN